MKKPLYAKEKTLFIIALVISLCVWAAVIVASKGYILILIPIFALAYLFGQSGFISYLKGTGALVSDAQYPDIHARAKECASKVGLKTVPDIYILHGNGMFNAFATRFLRKSYIILLSDVLDALEDDAEAINFYIGHEMGHIDRKHLIVEPILIFGLMLPLLGAAYSRAREYTCDLYGAACCSPEAAQKGLALLAVGAKRYKTINIEDYRKQTKATSGFWMSFHELIASYPWLVKRYARMQNPQNPPQMPGRNPFAYLLAIFIPRLNFTTLIIIYVLIFSVGMDEIIKDIRGESLNDSEEYSEYEPQPMEGTLAENLKYMVDGVNSEGPQNLDDVTILNSAHQEGDNTLVYDLTVTNSIDFENLQEEVYPGIKSYWCEGGAYNRSLLDSGLKVTYRYFDAEKTQMGDVVVDGSHCSN